MKQVLVVLVFITISACVSLPATPTGTGGRSAGSSAGSSSTTGSSSVSSAGATTKLLEQSRVLLAAGEYGQATAAMERALRIEPNNPYLWIELGQIHLASGNSQQAAALAQKAMSMAGIDPGAQRAAQRLLEQASTR